ncbi:predicted protein [Nematostella vectensis]|uniref:FAD-binding PCMH-type domain-containing protein n=1 Tax=Nematostella vectensis TaxID=45351 RepID=A7RQ67_NEMVE|nr:predicted protein [Nematostella vectensis]|eukprot:XP_001638504.1 predicted protein [Nematostella vectensis]
MSETGSCCSCLSSSGADTPTARVQLYVPSRVKFHSFPGELKTCADDPEISQRLSQGLSPTEQLSAICRFASRHNYTVQAKGTGSSMSRICSECDILIDMTSLDKIVTPRPAVREENLSKDYVDIEVEAGMRLKDFVETLDKHYGLALPVLGSNAGQTVAGAAMVSSHGSGLGAASLCITQCCPARSRDIINYGLTYFSLKKPFIHKWYNVLQLTKGTNSVRSAEWSLPLSRLDEALYDVIDTIKQLGLRNNEYTALPLHIRIAKTDDLMLSPANRKFQSGESQHCAYIEVPVLAGCKHTDDLYGAIESTLTTRYHARPHWGKYHSLTADSIRDLYPQLDDWKQVYRLLNSDGIFSSDFTDKMGFHLVLESEPGPSGENLNNDNHVITVQPAQ